MNELSEEKKAMDSIIQIEIGVVGLAVLCYHSYKEERKSKIKIKLFDVELERINVDLERIM